MIYMQSRLEQQVFIFRFIGYWSLSKAGTPSICKFICCGNWISNRTPLDAREL